MDRYQLTRRTLLSASATVAAASTTTRAIAAGLSPGKVMDLKVDGLSEPLGVESRAPRLSWRVETSRGGFGQRAYRIVVASSAEKAARGEADLWDSGRVASTSSLGISYRGRALRSRDRCHWRVEVWDDHGIKLPASVPASWEMGLLETADWRGDWLAAEDATTAGDRAKGLNWIWGPDPRPAKPVGFRRRLSLAKAPAHAELLIVARDAFEGVWLDGVAAAFTPFRPPAVNNARMLTIPLSLSAGEHTLAVRASYKEAGWPRSPSGGMAAILRITHSDGSIERIGTGPEWMVGEATDGWQAASFDARGWRAAVPAASKPADDPWPAGPAMLLRKAFTLPSGAVSARIYATALGAYELRLNGRRVGDRLLAPENTDFTKRALYQTYDVTDLLAIGDNVLGAVVGDGWYGSTGLFAGRFSFGPAPCRALIQLEVEHIDGSRTTIATSGRGGWRTAESAIRSSEIYDGEVYDARLEADRWDTPGFDAGAWGQAVEAPAPAAKLVAQVSPPIRVQRTLKPVAVREVRPGVHVFDFGQNFSGRCRLSGRAAAGTTVTLRHAEILDARGDIDQSNLRSAEARDTYVFRGRSGGEVYQPSFTYHGFRYVQLTGWPGTVPADLLEAEVLTTDLQETGTLRSASPLVSRVWLNTLWGQRSNFMGIPTDCPQRDERLGWNGDAQIFWDAASFNMDVDVFTRRFMGDLRDAQTAAGVFAEFNPQSREAKMRGAPGWADAGVLLPWTTWWRYGDTAIIDENWEAMTRWAEFVAARNPDKLWRNERGSDYGDWLALDAKQPGDETTPKLLCATAYWAHVTGKLAQMASATGRTAEAERYRARRAAIAAAFAREFIRADGSIGNGSQTGYILSLRFGLVAEPLRAAAAAHLVADIRRRGTVLSTGFMGTPHALDVLTDNGHQDVVAALLARTDYPSWGYMVRKGATTMWERWNSDVGDVAMNSFNHYALGAVVGFFYRRLAGIDAAAPGFAAIEINPAYDAGLPGAGATYDSVMGRIVTDWRRVGSRVTLEVQVPANTTARIHLPPSARRSSPSRAPAAPAIVEVGGGHHRFSS